MSTTQVDTVTIDDLPVTSKLKDALTRQVKSARTMEYFSGAERLCVAAGRNQAWNNAAKATATIARKTKQRHPENKPQERAAAQAFYPGANQAWSAAAHRKKQTQKGKEKQALQRYALHDLRL